MGHVGLNPGCTASELNKGSQSEKFSAALPRRGGRNVKAARIVNFEETVFPV